MGQTNTNIEQHLCSQCHNVRPLADFLYPAEVWWCSSCWAAFRAKQKETRRQKSQELLKSWDAKPHLSGWRVTRGKSKNAMATLSALHVRYEKCSVLLSSIPSSRSGSATICNRNGSRQCPSTRRVLRILEQSGAKKPPQRSPRDA